jgi:hypothetical protein
MVAVSSRALHKAKQWVSVATLLGLGLMVSGCEHHRTARETAVPKRYVNEVRPPTRSQKIAPTRKLAVAAPIRPRLMVAPDPVNCMIDRLDLERAKEKTGLSPDPKLVEIARLEEERTCFQQSAVAWRARLLELQGAVKQIHCICR